MNSQIQQAREVALSLLKPTPAQLEHGLELHRDSIVVDSYGFSPWVAPDADVITKMIEAGASAVEIDFASTQMMMTGAVTDPQERAEYLEAFEASGVTCVLQNAGEEGNAIPRLIERLARFTFVTDMMPKVISRAARPEQIIEAKKLGRRCLYLVANGVPIPNERISVEGELRYIQVFFQLGIRMMHLTYNRRNLIGDGCAETSDGGLSDFGKGVVKEMNRVGVIVDVAHSGLRTSLEAARASSRPMVVSHSTCRSLHEHIRGKTDEVIRAVADTGGYMGVACIPAFLGMSADINAMLDHLDHLIKTFGPDHVAIGTDTPYETTRRKAELAKMPHRPRRKPLENFWPPREPLHDSKWNQPHMRQSLAWTNWPLFTVGLVKRGHDDETIRKIIGGNVLRVARAVFESSDLVKPNEKGSSAGA